MMSFPFELPQWINNKYIKKQSLFYGLTYRNILEIFFSKDNTIYHVLETPRIGYYEHMGGSTFSFVNSTTYLTSLIDLIDSSAEMKSILQLCLQHMDDINFFHPTYGYNSLSLLKQKLLMTSHQDLISHLLVRKEIQIPEVISYLAPCFREDQHILQVLRLLENERLYCANVYGTIWINYMAKNHQFRLSRHVAKQLVDRCDLNFTEMFQIMFDTNRYDYIEFISFVDWKNLQGYNHKVFCAGLDKVFHSDTCFNCNAHGLLEIYTRVVKPYGISLSFENAYIKKVLLHYASHEIFLLFAVMCKLERFYYLLPWNSSLLKWIKKRYAIRYKKYIYYWRHRTYCPGSKMFGQLSAKYASEMPSAVTTLPEMCNAPPPPISLKQFIDLNMNK